MTRFGLQETMCREHWPHSTGARAWGTVPIAGRSWTLMTLQASLKGPSEGAIDVGQELVTHHGGGGGYNRHPGSETI